MEWLLFFKKESSIRLYNCLTNVNFGEVEVRELLQDFSKMLAFINKTKNFGLKSAEELYGLFLRFLIFVK